MTRQHTPKVVDVPLDFAEWGSGLSLASQADAAPQTRARVKDAFAAADAEAAARLAGPSHSGGKVFDEYEVWFVEPRGTQGWAVRSRGKSKAYRIFSTRQEAEKDAVARARTANVDGKVIIEIDVKGRESISPAARKWRRTPR